MVSQVVKEGTREELARWLWQAKQRGDVVEFPPARVDQLAGGRLRMVVRLQRGGVPAANGRGVPAAYPRRGSSAANPGLRRFDRRLAVTASVIAAIGASCYLAGVTGWGLGVLRNLGIAALVLVIVVVLIAVAINEVRDAGRR